MPFRKLVHLRGKQVTVGIILALALYLFPQICMAACPMMPVAGGEKCCCDRSPNDNLDDQISAQSCCEMKAAPAKDKILLSLKSAETPAFAIVSSDVVFPLASVIPHEQSELPPPLGRPAFMNPVLRI
ncbi:MAG: hypothetical protein HY541_01005 [Deltaproteobacteria bacterium]|nr:hypothetical protein [Deltaproteobacteria bacterium]